MGVIACMVVEGEWWSWCFGGSCDEGFSVSEAIQNRDGAEKKEKSKTTLEKRQDEPV